MASIIVVWYSPDNPRIVFCGEAFHHSGDRHVSDIPLSSFRVFADGLDHPEGVTLGPDGHVYAGGEAGQVYRISSQGEVNLVGSTGGFLLGLCLDAHGNIYACDPKKKIVARMTPQGEVTVYSSGTPDRPMINPNFPVFDAAGNLYVADSGNWHGNNGCIYRIRPGGSTEVVSTEFAEFPNGLSISPDGKELYVALSTRPSVAKAEILPNGQLGSPQMIVELPKTIPDGLAFDQDGNLFIACYTPDIIYRYTLSGELSVWAEDWESTMISSPTNVVFAGENLKTMVVASLARWHLASVDVDVPGSPLNYPAIET
jgi:gluconolactonase